MNIWIKKYAILVFLIGMGSTVFTMESPEKRVNSSERVATQESPTPDVIGEDREQIAPSPNLRRPKGAYVRHSRTKSGSWGEFQPSPDLRGSQDSDASGDDTYKIPAMPTPNDVSSAQAYLSCESDVLDRREIHRKYDERTDIPGQQHYMEVEPIARKFRDILLLVWYKKQCGVELDQHLTIEHLGKIQSNEELYDEAVALLALVVN